MRVYVYVSKRPSETATRTSFPHSAPDEEEDFDARAYKKEEGLDIRDGWVGGSGLFGGGGGCARYMCVMMILYSLTQKKNNNNKDGWKWVRIK